MQGPQQLGAAAMGVSVHGGLGWAPASPPRAPEPPGKRALHVNKLLRRYFEDEVIKILWHTYIFLLALDSP